MLRLGVVKRLIQGSTAIMNIPAAMINKPVKAPVNFRIERFLAVLVFQFVD